MNTGKTMWLLAQIQLIALMTYALLGLYIFFRNPFNQLNRSLAIFVACLAVWSVEQYCYSIPIVTHDHLKMINTLGSLGWIGMPPAYVWFIQTFTGQSKTQHSKWLLRIALSVGLIIFIAQFKGLLTSKYTLMPYGWFNTWNDNFWAYLFFIYYPSLMISALVMLAKYIKRATDSKRKHQARLLFIFTLIALSLATLTDVIASVFNFISIPPIGNVLSLIWAVHISYSIAKYQLLIISPATAAENIISNMSDLLVLTDTEGYIVRVNRAVETCLSMGRYNLEGRHISEIIEKADSEKSPLHLLGPMENQRLQFKTRFGRIVPAIISSSPLMDGDRSIGNTLLIKDITRLQDAENALKTLRTKLARAEKMEAIGTLAGAVAHDLNNVLSGVVTYPDLLLLSLPDDAGLKKMVQTIKTSGQKAAAIVEDLLTLSRRAVITTETVNLNQIVRNYLSSPEYDHLIANFPNTEVRVELAQAPLYILGSPLHLEKTLMNLLVNAFEALPETGGTIMIQTLNNQPAPSSQAPSPVKGIAHWVTLRIKDTGSGIAPEDQERIFEPFFTRKVMGRSGTGLGMAVVWGAVQDHGGYVDLKSKLGEGTEFTLYFPATDKAIAPSIQQVRLETYLGQGETILVVDDVDTQLEMAKDILTRLNYKAYTTASGESAVEFLKDHPVDLVLLDMIMDPGMDGLETFRQIIRLKPNQKVVIASGYSKSERIQKAMEEGVIACIKKPYLLEQIGLTLYTALQNGQVAK